MNVTTLRSFASFSFFFFVFSIQVIRAQVDVNRFQNIISSVSGGSAAYGAGFKGRYNAEGMIKGDPYLDSAFTEIKYIFFKSNSYFSGPSRYDIFNDEFEIKTTAGIRVIQGALVKGYSILKGGDSLHFINANQYKFDDTLLAGYFQVLSNGEIPLLKYTRIEVVKPSYNPSLEVGDRNTHLVKKETTYFAVNGNLNKLKGKKEILKAFASAQEKVSAFIQSEKLEMKDEKDLIAIFNYYNSIVQKH